MSQCLGIIAIAENILILRRTGICHHIVVDQFVIKKEEPIVLILVQKDVIRVNANPVTLKELSLLVNVENHKELSNAAKKDRLFNAVRNVRKY